MTKQRTPNGKPTNRMTAEKQEKLLKKMFGKIENLLGFSSTMPWHWWNDDIGRFRASWAFRGLSYADYDLTTKLERMGENCWEVEPFMYRNFKKYAEASASVGKSDWHWLSVAQHHELPTRLLDWTNSPLVALHFATCETDKYDKNGVIWMVDFSKAHNQLPECLGKLLTRHGTKCAHAFTVDELANEFKEINMLDDAILRLYPSERNCILFFEPPSIDARIANQYALFSMKLGADKSHQNWVKANMAFCHKLIIPKRLKPMIRDFLDQMNITERVLFPGLDGLCDWLARYYGKSFHKT